MAVQNTTFEQQRTVENEYTDLSFGPYDQKNETVGSNSAERCFKESEPKEVKAYLELSSLPNEHVYNKLTPNIAENTFKPLEAKTADSKYDMYADLYKFSDDQIYCKIASKNSENPFGSILFCRDKRKIVFLCTGVTVVIIAACVAVAVVLTTGQYDQKSTTPQPSSTGISTDTTVTSGSSESTTQQSGILTTEPSTDTWLSWGSWTACTTTCGSGTYKRYRSCNGLKCHGDYVEIDFCTVEPCPVYGQWTTWTSWSSCSVSCGGGVQTRTRTCTKPNAYELDCVGDSSQQTTCSSWNCPDCSQTCAVGTLNTACDTCVCEGATVNGRVLADDSGFPIGNAGIYATSAPTTLLALSDSNGNFTLNSTCLTSELFLSRTGFQDAVVEIEQTYQEIRMKKIVLPYLSQQPQPKRRLVGESVTFCCSAVAEPEVTYIEWMKDSVIFESSNNSAVTIIGLSLQDDGNYQCRANSPAGAVMSPAARLEVRETPNAFCADALQQKTIALPDDCIQSDTNTTAFEVGECLAKGCRANGSSDSVSCLDEIRSCCSIAVADLVPVQCSGYELEVVVVRSCGCAACTSSDIAISGFALALDDEDPVKFAEVWVNGVFKSYTAIDGSFSFDVSKITSRVTINIQDNYFRQFLPGIKVVTITEAMSGTLNVDIHMIRTTEPIPIDSTVENTLVAGSSSEDASVPIVQMSIPANAFYYSNGTQYIGTVQASLTFLDPKNSSLTKNIPGVFQFVDEEGQTGNLASLGVFNLYFSDESGEGLILDEVIDLFIPADVDAGDNEIKLWKLNPESGIWEYNTAGTGTRRRKRQNTARWVGEIDWSTVSDRSWWNYDYVKYLTQRPCYFKVRLFKDNLLTEQVINPERYLQLEYHILKDNAVTTISDHFYSPEDRCITGICENDNAYVSVYYYGRRGLEVMYVGKPALSSEGPSYSITDESKVLKVQMTFLDKGPFFDSKTVCIASSVSEPHFRYYFEKPSAVFTLVEFFKPISGSRDLETQMSLSKRAWYPARTKEGYRVCFLKVRVLFKPNIDLTPGQSIKVRATSYGGTNAEITGIALGIREYPIENVTNGISFCVEYKCSGSIDPVFSVNSIDYTRVKIELIYPKADIECSVSNEADFVTADVTRLNSYQNGSTNGSYELYAPSVYSPSTGLYSATSDKKDIYNAFNTAEGECLSGTPYLTSIKPEEGVGVTFSCGNARYG